MARTIGIVGGMSPESTIAYYQRIVRLHQEAWRDHAYPRMVIASVSFQRYIDLQHSGAWDAIAEGLEEEFVSLAKAGADFAVLATNTMHKVLPAITSPIPILHVVDAVAAHASAAGVTSIGLTGTKFTMSDPFYADALKERGFRVVVPAPAEQDEIHRIIYQELIGGRVTSDSEKTFAAFAGDLRRRGADAILLGCTELQLLTQNGLDVPLIDSTTVHADAAWRRAVADE